MKVNLDWFNSFSSILTAFFRQPDCVFNVDIHSSDKIIHAKCRDFWKLVSCVTLPLYSSSCSLKKTRHNIHP